MRGIAPGRYGCETLVRRVGFSAFASEPPALEGAPDATIRPRSGIERPCFGIAPVLRLFAFPVGALVSRLVNAALIATCVLGHDSLLGLGANADRRAARRDRGLRPRRLDELSKPVRSAPRAMR